MYYTARWKQKDSLRIGVAVADHPAGPFKDAFDKPMFDFGYAPIDAHVFTDDDGRSYLFYARDCSEHMVDGRHESHIYGFELSGDLLQPKHEGVMLLKPEQEWELASGEVRRWNEGPFVLKHQGSYYLMYSANFYAHRDYSVGYAVSGRPLGPYLKYEHNPVLASDRPDISGPGHHSVVRSPDDTELFIAYHTHTDSGKGGGDRQVCIDRMTFREDGSIAVAGPTPSPQPYPSAKGARSG